MCKTHLVQMRPRASGTQVPKADEKAGEEAGEEEEEEEKRTCNKCKRTDRLFSGREHCCNTCNSKRAVLSKMFNGWPIPPFEQLHEDDQTEFWANSGSTQQMLTEMLVKTIAKKVIRDRKTSVGGTFEPKSWYVSHGYNVESVEKKLREALGHTARGVDV